MEIYEQHGDPEEVRAMLGHKRLETTQVHMRIRQRHEGGQNGSTLGIQN